MLQEENSIQNGFICSVCLDIFYFPHVCLPCKHIYCSPCLRELHLNHPVETKCPLCRDIITQCMPEEGKCSIRYNKLK